MGKQPVSMYAWVRQKGRPWRDAPLEVVSVPWGAHHWLDRRLFGDTIGPCEGLRIDGLPAARVRLSDGRIAAVTLVSIDLERMRGE